MTDPNIKAITIPVIAARSRIRRRAVPNARFDRFAEAAGFARFLAEGLDYLHRAERLGDHRADIGDPILAVAGNVAQPPADEHDRQDHDRNSEQQSGGELGRKREQIGDAANAHDDVAKRHRHCRAYHHLDDCGVGGHPRCDLGRTVLLEEAGLEAKQVPVDLAADVGDDTLAQPGDEIEAGRRRQRQHHDDQQQILEMLGDIAATSCKPLVDDAPKAVGDSQGCGRGDQQGDYRPGDMAGITNGVAPHHRQISEFSARR